MDYTAELTRTKRERLTNRVVDAGLGVNVVLALLKVTVGIIGHSRALLADGINSTSDVAYYIVVKIFTRLAGKPADKEHRACWHGEMGVIGDKVATRIQRHQPVRRIDAELYIHRDRRYRWQRFSPHVCPLSGGIQLDFRQSSAKRHLGNAAGIG